MGIKKVMSIEVGQIRKKLILHMLLEDVELRQEVAQFLRELEGVK